MVFHVKIDYVYLPYAHPSNTIIKAVDKIKQSIELVLKS